MPATIDFVDSCLWATTNVAAGTNGLAVKYNKLSGSGAQMNLIAGPDHQGTYFFSATVGVTAFQVVLTSQQRRLMSFSLIVINARNPESIVWSWNTATLGVGCITLGADGKLRLYAGGNGTTSFGSLSYVSNTILSIGTWYYIDLDLTFPLVGSGSASLYVNDVLDTNNPGHPSAPSVNWLGHVPDRFNIVWANNASTGYATCDTVMGYCSPTDLRIGPCRVDFVRMAADNLTQWLTTYTGPAQPNSFSAIAEDGIATLGPSGAPDLNYAFIATATALASSLFSTAAVPCFAGILAIAINACVVDPNSGNCDLIVRPVPSNAIDVIVGGIACPSPQPPGSGSTEGYRIRQAITQDNGGDVWTDGAIENAWWGIRSIGGTPRCTQLFLEKVTTRRALPFTCGQLGSYCF